MNAARKLLFMAMIFIMLGVPTYAYIFLVSKAQDALYGPVCERECKALSLRHEELARGRGPSVKGCICTNGNRTTKVLPQFYVDVPVLNSILDLLVTIIVVLGAFAFVYAPFGVLGFIAERRSAGAKEREFAPPPPP